jgi:hypothetical protein
MNSKDLNRILEEHDLGDDLFEDENRLFDKEFTPIPQHIFSAAMGYANEKMAWYWADQQKHYLLADCNRFHWMFLGHMQEFLTKRGIRNPILGRPYGLWNGQPHAWAYAYTDRLIFINWGNVEWPEHYDGKGSSAV